MNKQKRTFVILAIVLAACLAGYLGLLNYNKYKSDDDSELSLIHIYLRADKSARLRLR